MSSSLSDLKKESSGGGGVYSSQTTVTTNGTVAQNGGEYVVVSPVADITLPANPAVGDRVKIGGVGYNNSKATYQLIRNNQLLDGSSADPFNLGGGSLLEYVFFGGSIGWMRQGS